MSITVDLLRCVHPSLPKSPKKVKAPIDPDWSLNTCVPRRTYRCTIFTIEIWSVTVNPAQFPFIGCGYAEAPPRESN